jgi:hypothetical protein
MAPDTRVTLYWNANLNTDSKGQAKFRFNNNSTTKRYRIVIQGMDEQGRVGYLNVMP